jgi:hypothetical protein
MRVRWLGQIACVGLALTSPYAIPCQGLISSPAATKPLDAATAQVAMLPPEEVIGEIKDGSTGDLWLLTRNREHPAGPARLLREMVGQGESGRRFGKTIAGETASGIEPSALRPVIHMGDRVTVEEHTAGVDARLEAVALSSASAGSRLSARLRIGGKVVQAVAVAPGHATLVPEPEMQR